VATVSHAGLTLPDIAATEEVLRVSVDNLEKAR
jgi:hypothetical protein